jgi:Ran GTPase-activating protein (RanGAP) involved in mRNA processing and transport
LSGLRVLNVSQNNFDDAGSAVIFDAVARCASLEILYVEDNKASFMAGKSLAKLLDGDETDSKLVEVYVGWNMLRGSASVDVAAALQKNYRLKVTQTICRFLA